jgi:hypothetical protein
MQFFTIGFAAENGEECFSCTGPYLDVARVLISFLMIIVLPDCCKQHGRERCRGVSAERHEVLRMFFDELARLDRAPCSAIIEFHARLR